MNEIIQDAEKLAGGQQGRPRNRRAPPPAPRSSSCVASPWQYGQSLVPSARHRKRRRIPGHQALAHP